MPNIGLLSTVTALAQAYCSNGRNQEQAMVEVGYSKAYARSYCGKLWADKRLIDAIERIDAKTAKELDHNRAIAIGLLTEALAIARLKNDNQGIVSATRELNAISGLHSYTIHTDSQQQQDLDKQQKIEAQRLANISLRQG